MSRVLIPLPTRGFDPTEAAIPWKVVRDRNLITARWPGDARWWSMAIDELLRDG
jgi:putative intracellular protease/amidase